MRFTTCFALAGGLVCAGTIMAAAWPATTTSNVNVRSGPGARYSVVNSLPAGVPVDVLSCSGAWCQTQYGYVNSRLLAQNAAAAGMAGAQAMPNYAANPGTNYRQNYAPALAGQQVYAPRAAGQPAAPYLAQSAAAPYSPAQPAHQDTSPGHPGQSESMSGARTTIGTANVRSGPGVEFDIVKTLPDFTKVEVQSCANAWCQTDEGYISLYLLSRGPVQQVLSPAAQPRIPGSATRDSSNYYGNVAGQAAMGYGAAGTGQTYAPQAYAPGAASYAPRAAAQPLAQPYAPAMAQSGTNYRATYPGAAGAPGMQQQAAVGGTATTTANVNVRGGPGVRYGVIASLPAGAPVNIMSCSGSWCQTQYGFVSARHIAQGGAAPGFAPGLAPTGLPQTRALPAAPAYAPRATAQAYAPAMQAYAPPRTVAQQPAVAPSMMPAASPYLGQPHQDAAPGHPGQSESMSGARTTIGTANVRSGPGVEYNVVKTLPDFTKVEVQSCANAWCQTDEGYISLYLLSRGPVQQVLSPAAQPRIPGSATRDSSNYAANVMGQAAMGYGAAGTGQQYIPQAAPAYAQSPGTNYRQTYAPATAAQAARAYAPAIAGQPQAYGAASGGTAVTTANTNVRGGPGARFALLGTLPAGSPVNVVSCAGAWCQTQYGYVSSRLISRGGMGAEAQQIQPIQQAQPVQPQTYARSYAPAAQAAAPVARSYAPTQPRRAVAQAPLQNDYAAATGAGYAATTISDLNVRSGPGMGYDVLNTLPSGTAVEVASCTGSWCQTQYGYVSARHLSNGEADPARVVVRPSQVTGGNYSNASYVDPAFASGGYTNAGYGNAGNANPIYNSQGFVPGPYPLDNPLLDIAAAPFVGVAAAVTQAFGGYGSAGYGVGYDNWTASWGPQFYWGPGFRGPNRPAYWGARPSYWGGRPTYWNQHPGYRTYSNFGDRRGNMYWSRRNEGRRPQAASWYGNGGMGPYGMAASRRPLLWQPRAGIY